MSHDPTASVSGVLTPADVAQVRAYLLELQERIVGAMEVAGGEPFLRDAWVLSTKVGRLLRPRPSAPEGTDRRYPLPFEPDRLPLQAAVTGG